MITQKGIAASPGFAIGKAFVYRKVETAVERLEVTDVEGELEKLNKALSISKQELEEIKLKTAQSGRSEADIFQAQLLMLEDPRLLREIRENVTKEKVNIEASVQDAIERHAAVFDAMSDPYFRARAADVRDVGARILKNLQGRGQDSLDALTSKVIVVAQNLAPSDTGRMNRQMVLGFATDTGGLTAHTAILARSLRIPAVVGLRDIAEKARAGMDLIVDGINGIVVLEPTNEAIAQYEREDQIPCTSR